MPRALNRTALVTGGVRGPSLAVAEALAREGFDLAICGIREPDAAAPAVAALKALGIEAIYFQADIALRDARFRLLQGVRQKFGRLHALINNANLAPPEARDVLELGEDAFERVQRTNLQGPFFLAQSAARWMIEQRLADPDYEGAIIFLNAALAGNEAPNFAGHCVATSGVSGAATVFAARLAGSGVSVHEVSVNDAGGPADAAHTVAWLARGERRGGEATGIVSQMATSPSKAPEV